jgi:hypothetical protein
MSQPRLKLKKLPYLDTEVPVDRSRNDILKLLKAAGADGIQWSEIFRPTKTTELRFVKNNIGYSLKIPVDTTDIDNQRQFIAPYRFAALVDKRERGLHRALFQYVQALVKAHQWGLLKFEEAFAGHINIMLPNGERMTVAEAVVARKTGLMQLPEAQPQTTAEVHE